MPTTTTSAGSSAPDEVTTQPTGQPSRESPEAGSLPETSAGRNSADDSPKRNSTPCSRCSAANFSPSSGPSAL